MELHVDFKDTLRNLRTERGLSQQQLAELLFVDRSTVASWETGRRVPDLATLNKVSAALNVDFTSLISGQVTDIRQNVIMVDDESIILTGSRPVLQKVFPLAEISCFRKASEALEFAKSNSVAFALIDIELGSSQLGGIDLSKKLLEIDPSMNVIFVTSYPDFALKAWSTGACGFLLKPLNEDDLQECLNHLRFTNNGVSSR